MGEVRGDRLSGWGPGDALRQNWIPGQRTKKPARVGLGRCWNLYLYDTSGFPWFFSSSVRTDVTFFSGLQKLFAGG
jgi:hypothetical protein